MQASQHQLLRPSPQRTWLPRPAWCSYQTPRATPRSWSWACCALASRWVGCHCPGCHLDPDWGMIGPSNGSTYCKGGPWLPCQNRNCLHLLCLHWRPGLRRSPHRCAPVHTLHSNVRHRGRRCSLHAAVHAVTLGWTSNAQCPCSCRRRSARVPCHAVRQGHHHPGVVPPP